MTIFAPNDESYDNRQYHKIKKSPNIVYYHVVKHIIPEEIPAKAFETKSLLTMHDYTISLVKPYNYDYDAYILFKGKKVDVVSTDIMASNGVIHEINPYIRLPKEPLEDFVQVLRVKGNFNTFLSYLNQQKDSFKEIFRARYINTWTIFAPTDEAFESTDIHLINATEISHVIWRHFIAKIIPSNALNENETVVETYTSPSEPKALLGLKNIEGNIEINYKGNIIESTSVDTMASNGVIHAIDSLILPPQEIISTTVTIKGMN